MTDTLMKPQPMDTPIVGGMAANSPIVKTQNGRPHQPPPQFTPFQQQAAFRQQQQAIYQHNMQMQQGQSHQLAYQHQLQMHQQQQLQLQQIQQQQQQNPQVAYPTNQFSPQSPVSRKV
jgi:hypothetical protein